MSWTPVSDILAISVFGRAVVSTRAGLTTMDEVTVQSTVLEQSAAGVFELCLSPPHRQRNIPPRPRKLYL